MSEAKPGSGLQGGRKPGIRSIICPYCCHPFRSSDALAISRNSTLGRDRVVLDDQDRNIRFLPSRFAENGNPLDPAGSECHEYACPECHLGLSRNNLVAEPNYFSLVGAPQSGKSFFLTASTWRLQTILLHLRCSLLDASPRENTLLREYARRLFESDDRTAPIEPLSPTDWRNPPNSVQVRIRNRTLRLLKPFQFLFRANKDWMAEAIERATAANGTPPGRLLNAAEYGSQVLLYDNPGEDHLAQSSEGLDSASHMRFSKVLLFTLNPLGDRSLRARCDQSHPLVKNPPAIEVEPRCAQNLVFSEAVRRIARLKGAGPAGSIGARVVVAVTKADLWPELYEQISTPLEYQGRGRPSLPQEEIDRVSTQTKLLVRQAWPEFVDAADRADEAQAARFFPVSVLKPSACRGDNPRVIRGEDVHPAWCEVPLLWSILRTTGCEPRRRKVD
ncbi:MAG TPA: hypothetical protein VK176_15410 [Phycisphaerales bacterium]|nr:hypothetical protein [Phycisphaerales bacterium]